MLARDVMSRNVVTVRPDMPARAAAAVLVVHGFTSAPVVTAEGVLQGMVTEAELMRGQPLRDLTHIHTAPDTTAGEAMMPNPMTMRPIDDLSDIVAVMLDDGRRSVPIVEDGRLVGIISRRDILRCVARRELVPRGADPEHVAPLPAFGWGDVHRRDIGDQGPLPASSTAHGVNTHAPSASTGTAPLAVKEP